jgi:MerR family transcriptional regulator, copper efflux regulator
MKPDQFLKIGDVARVTRLTVDTIRFYEKEGLLGPVRRSAGIRCFDRQAVKRLDFVRRAVGLGFSLSEIRSLLSLRVSSRSCCAAVQARALSKMKDIEARISQLRCMWKALEQVAATCATTVNGTCPFLDSLELPALRAPAPIRSNDPLPHGRFIHAGSSGID